MRRVSGERLRGSRRWAGASRAGAVPLALSLALCGCGGGSQPKPTTHDAVVAACEAVSSRLNATVAGAVGISPTNPHPPNVKQLRSGAGKAAATTEAILHELQADPGAVAASQPLATRLSSLAGEFRRVSTEPSSSVDAKVTRLGELLTAAEEDCTRALRRT